MLASVYISLAADGERKFVIFEGADQKGGYQLLSHLPVPLASRNILYNDPMTQHTLLTQVTSVTKENEFYLKALGKCGEENGRSQDVQEAIKKRETYSAQLQELVGIIQSAS